MPTKKYTCPKCGNEIEMDDDALRAVGYSIICPECQTILKIEGDYAYVPTAEETFETKPVDESTIMAENGPQVQSVEPEIVELPPEFHPIEQEDPYQYKSERFRAAVEYIKTCNAITIPMLKSYFEISDQEAIELMRDLEQEGVVGPFTGAPRKILIPHESNLVYGTRRTYAQDQAMKGLMDQMKQAAENGEGPKVHSCGCSIRSLIFWIVLGLVLSYILNHFR